jgi:hypothetical protein
MMTSPTLTDEAVDELAARDERHHLMYDAIVDHVLEAIVSSLPSAGLAYAAQEDLYAAVNSIVWRLDEAGLTVVDRGEMAERERAAVTTALSELADTYDAVPIAVRYTHEEVAAALRDLAERLQADAIGAVR